MIPIRFEIANPAFTLTEAATSLFHQELQVHLMLKNK